MKKLIKSEQNDEIDYKKVIKVVKYCVIISFLIILLFSTFYQVNAGERAVLLTFGKPNMNAIGEGLHFKIPIVQTATKMNVKTQKYQANLSASSKDLQDVQTAIAINYRIIDSKAPEIYKTIGTNYADIVIYPLEQEINKAITAGYTAEELITKREDVRQKMKDSLTEKLFPRNIIVEEISIVNFAFSDSFSQAIESKVTAEQNALAAKNKLEQVKYEAQQAITQAEGQAEAQSLLAKSVTSETIEYQKLQVQLAGIQKWNGILPQVTGSAVPFISLPQSTQQPTGYTTTQ